MRVFSLIKVSSEVICLLSDWMKLFVVCFRVIMINFSDSSLMKNRSFFYYLLIIYLKIGFFLFEFILMNYFDVYLNLLIFFYHTNSTIACCFTYLFIFLIIFKFSILGTIHILMLLLPFILTFYPIIFPFSIVTLPFLPITLPSLNQFT